MPRELRDYILGEKIADGGMSTLYLGIQKSLEREVAIKVLQPALALNEDFIRRFEREAKIVSRIRHRNIVSLIDYGTEQDLYFIVMEYVEGMDLQRVIEIESQIPPPVALAIVEEMAQGLEAAHDKGVWHRDMKPANVLLGREGDVKVADFGLARESSDIARFSSMTLPGTILGTYPYMSPEQATRQPMDQRSDIFSLGALAYELFTGSRAFQGETHTEVIERILKQPADPMRERNVLVTRGIEAVVSRMLQKDPESRYSSMREVLDALSACWDALDPSGAMVRSRLQYLRSFAQDPVRFSASLRASTIKDLLARGQHFVSLGQGRLSDAIEAFSAVLYLDPTNEYARSSLADLQNRVVPQAGGERIDRNRQVPPTTICGPEQDAGAAPQDRADPGISPVAPAPARPADVSVPSMPRPQRRLFLAALGLVAAVAVLGYAWLTVRHPRPVAPGSPASSSPAQPGTQGGAESPAADRGTDQSSEAVVRRNGPAAGVSPGPLAAGPPKAPPQAKPVESAFATRPGQQAQGEIQAQPATAPSGALSTPAAPEKPGPVAEAPKGSGDSTPPAARETSPGERSDSGAIEPDALLSVRVEPYGILYVDGSQVGPVAKTWHTVSVAPGRHSVSLVYGDSTYAFPEQRLESGTTKRLTVTFPVR
jgi:serine/threonine protein kinase